MNDRKPDPRKKLAALTAAQAAELMGWLRTPGISLARGAELVREKFGITVSDTTLSKFYEETATAEIREKTIRSAGIAASAAKVLEEKRPEMRAATKGQLTRVLFDLAQGGADEKTIKTIADVVCALEHGDREDRRLAQAQQALEQQDRKIKLLEQKAALADAASGVMADGEMSEDEKAKRLKQIFRMS